ncbi:MAG: hypothetical protein KDC38_08360 [Planctomycetes bacterium]|nr:hypothetical protein [Planctomycetota bacterium]
MNFDVVNDEDWFCYTIEDTAFGIINPRIAVTGIPAGMSVEILTVILCDVGGVGADATSSAGASSVELFPFFSCGGFDESMAVRFCVRQDGGPLTCESVLVSWGDD